VSILSSMELDATGLFDLLTKAYMRKSNKETPGVGVAVAAGIVSCCLGQTVSFPLETISRRLQVRNLVLCLNS